MGGTGGSASRAAAKPAGTNAGGRTFRPRCAGYSTCSRCGAGNARFEPQQGGSSGCMRGERGGHIHIRSIPVFTECCNIEYFCSFSCYFCERRGVCIPRQMLMVSVHPRFCGSVPCFFPFFEGRVHNLSEYCFVSFVFVYNIFCFRSATYSYA